MKNVAKEIKHALIALKVRGKVAVSRIASDRFEVSVNGDYFGIWDAEKKTFVA